MVYTTHSTDASTMRLTVVSRAALNSLVVLGPRQGRIRLQGTAAAFVTSISGA